MNELGFQPTVRINDKGIEVYVVPGPDLARDKKVPLSEAADYMATRFGQKPVRATLYRWRTEGYPVDKDGPRVIFPTMTQLKYVHTSMAAMTRFFRMIQFLNEDIQSAGGVPAWRYSRNERKSK